jgi:hypothetical protein
MGLLVHSVEAAAYESSRETDLTKIDVPLSS